MRTLRGLIFVPAIVLGSGGAAFAQSDRGAPEPATAPAPAKATPLSTAGTDLMPAETSSSGGAAGSTTADSATIAAMKARMDALEAELKEDREARKEKDEDGWWKRVEISGFVQPQIYWQTANAAGSSNATLGGLPTGISANQVIAHSDGTTSNTDGFRIRRAWLMTELRPTESVRAIFEIDPSTLGGAQDGVTTIARHIEAQGITRFPRDVEVTWGAGIFVVPFGFELQQEHPDRPFIEQSWGARNLFPGEFDTGAHAHGSALKKHLTFDLAIVNGVTEGEKSFSLVPDLNHGKDFVARVNFNIGPADLGVSGYAGEGQTVDTASLRFKQFRRDAVNIEAAFHHKLFPKLGGSRVFGELTFATNLDRGTNYAFALPTIPTNLSESVRNMNERSLFIRAEQDLGRRFTLGARYDFYTPDTSVKNDGRDTFAFVGVVHFTKGLQLMAEYDHAVDNVHMPLLQAPSRHVDSGSGVLQARF